MNLSQLLERQALQFPDKKFLLFEKLGSAAAANPGSGLDARVQLTYGEFNRLVNQVAGYLRSIGIGKGDVYNLHLPNCPAFLLLWFAGARLGAVMMPTNLQASADEMHYLLAHSESRVCFTSKEKLETIRQCQESIKSLQQIIYCDPTSTSFLANAALEDFPGTAISADVLPLDLAAIMYTSGTTSKPKGVMVTHANYIKAGQTVADAIRLTEQDRHYVVLPLFHGNAQYYSFMSALLRGASVVLMDRFSASQYFTKCIEYGCTVASLFAAPMRMILAQPENTAHRKNELRAVIYAQNISSAQMADWQRRFDVPLCQLWGMTETMGPPLMNPLFGELRNTTVGKPVGGYEVELVDHSGAAVADGEVGEIVVAGIPGETLMAGYFKNPEATRETLRDGWLYTGDNAIRDKDGYFRFIDRLKDMIKRSGENVSAGEVEAVIMQHPAVFECAVVGLPDEIRDEQIVAVVVLKPGQVVSTAQLIDHCAQRLASFRVPQLIDFRQTLPRTAVGKIQKHLLREEMIAQLSSSGQNAVIT